MIQGRLLALAAAFLFLYATILTLSPAVRERSWDVDYRWGHWIGFAMWAGLFAAAHWQTRRRLPESDALLLPIAALFTGWGVLTIWRLDSTFGMRQTAWLAVSVVVLIASLRWPSNLNFLRRYRYIWLIGGLTLTALTLIFGVNPMGDGPRLWLGCCGFYFQPSEPLKLLLIVYLSAYLADRMPSSQRIIPLVMPTVFLTGVALLILVVQRDLGTASIFIFLYAAILYLATGRGRVVLVSLLVLLATGLIGYLFVDIIRLRIDVWLNPWQDPSGSSYQVIQSLMAFASGGLPGRGAGIGFPYLVPVALSDFIFAAIGEEAGLVGTLAVLALIAALMMRGFRGAVRAPGHFRRLLGAGIAAYFGMQSLFIIGGNLRLLPLTGVTLPFVSYGGSSLLTSFLALAMLLHISNRGDDEPASLPRPFPYLAVSGFLLTGLFAAALANAWWAIVRGPDLLARSDNPRRSIADQYVKRGDLLDRDGAPINVTWGQPSEYARAYLYPQLAATTGFTDPVFGQSGLEAGLDPHLRGLQGNPSFTVWWDHLLYGFPPPGLDMRTSLHLSAQEAADTHLAGKKGAAVLLDAQRGEILAMASHPTYDPAKLAEERALFDDPDSPLLNRATQGIYSAGSTLDLFENAGTIEAGMPLNAARRAMLYNALGFYTAPTLPLVTAPASQFGETQDLTLSPLQMALATASLTAGGNRPPPWMALAADTPTQGWVILPASGDAVSVFSPETAREEVEAHIAEGAPYWEYIGQSTGEASPVTWYLAGTLPDWPGSPLTVVVALEETNPALAREIGRAILDTAIQK
jgi:cell division protein FtsW (lipid II flippase)